MTAPGWITPELLRAIVLIAVTLTISGIALLFFPVEELRRRWRTWFYAALLLIAAAAFGAPGMAVFAAALAVVGSIEYARLVDLRAADRAVLILASVGLPLIAVLWPRWFGLPAAGLLLLAAVVPPLLGQDAEGGAARAARTAFGLLWLPVALSGLVTLGGLAVVACVAIAFADVGGWCGGKALGRRGPLARSLSRLSPAKTWGGVVGSAVFAGLALVALDSWTPLRWLAVVLGCIAGDLLESMLKRGAGVKDAGRWLPGFGGLLDRIDSLLITVILLGVTS
jgi:phosphatidate cytidylyltransferase